jgi:hypothetical protein
MKPGVSMRFSGSTSSVAVRARDADQHVHARAA